MRVYYNEIDQQRCEWLKEYTQSGFIPAGDVNHGDIVNVIPAELNKYDQVHLFAGIGGWPYALRLADWPEDKQVWTGSCPCQPFSRAGLGRGVDDPRHLWPAFRWLISQCRPATIFGEQSASSDGREWLDGVRSDMEAMGYEVGAADLCAAGVDAPHIRQRLFWVANLDGAGFTRERQAQPTRRQSNTVTSWESEEISYTHEKGRKDIERCSRSPEQDRREGVVSNNDRRRTRQWPPEPDVVRVVHGVSAGVGSFIGALGDTIVPRLAAEFIKVCLAM